MSVCIWKSLSCADCPASLVTDNPDEMAAFMRAHYRTTLEDGPVAEKGCRQREVEP